MKTVEKKIWPVYFNLILNGQKTYEFRIADFNVEPGDTLLLREWNPETRDYTGREIGKTIGFVGKIAEGDLNMFYSTEDIKRYGMQVISLMP